MDALTMAENRLIDGRL